MWFLDDPVICILILIWMVKAPKIRYLTQNTTLWIRYFGHPNMMKRTHIFLVLALIVIITVKMSNGSRRRSSSSSSSSRRRSSAIRNTVRTRRIIDTRRSIRTRRIRLPRSEYFYQWLWSIFQLSSWLFIEFVKDFANSIEILTLIMRNFNKY